MMAYAVQQAPELSPARLAMAIEDAVALVVDFQNAFRNCLYISMAPEQFGYDESFKGTDSHTAVVKKLREKFVAEALPKFMDFFTKKLSGGCFLCGPMPTIADCWLIPELRKFQAGHIDFIATSCLDAYPAITAYIARFLELPAIKAWYGPKDAAAPAAKKAPQQQKKAKAPQQAPMTAEEKEAKKAAEAAEKLKKKVIKEGGKKGVEIEGASEMGGLEFFCTTIESPDGDCDLLLLAMDAMNAQPEEGDEERKGCSGHVGKMIFSAGANQLAIVSYVPAAQEEKIDVVAWTDSVLAITEGKIATPAAPALKDDMHPHGGKVVVAYVTADPDKDKFPIKIKDVAMKAAFDFLRAKGAFPEDNGDDSDDEPCYGDDAFDEMNGW